MTDELKMSNRQKKARAREIWLEHGGEIDMKSLGEQVGLSRQTCSRTRAAQGWDADLAAAHLPAKTAAIEVVRDSVEAAYSRHIRTLEKLDNRIEQALEKPHLSSSEIANLSKAAAQTIQTSRLLRGESTANHAVKGEMTVDSVEQRRLDDNFQRALEKIIQTGDSEGQAALAAMIQAQQKVMSILDP